MRRFLFATVAICASPASAEVIAVSDSGFEVRGAVEVATGLSDTWKELVTPAHWWSKEHTYSADPANLSIDPRATGCFCERLPSVNGGRPGSVEHMRVVYVDPGKRLRMSGALGPLQSEALNGTLTITLEPAGGKTRIAWEYVVGGYMRYKPKEIAPVVDKVLAEQLARLASKLDPVGAGPAAKGAAAGF